MNNEMELPICIPDSNPTYQFLASSLSVLKTEPHLLPWYYENFVEIYLTKDNHLNFVGNSFDIFGVLNHIAEYSSYLYSMNFAGKLSDFITNQIAKEQKYAYIFLDEYYIESSSSYRKEHFFHDSLIYGYSNYSEEFYALSYNSNRKFTTVKYKYSEIEIAYAYGQKMAINIPHTIGIVFFSLIPVASLYDFSIKRFADSLCRYLRSEKSEHRNYFVNSKYKLDTPSTYGCAVYMEIIKCFEKIEAFSFYNFRTINFLCEHKKLMLETIKYLNDRKVVDADFSKYCTQYATVLEMIEIVRSLCIKCIYGGVPTSNVQFQIVSYLKKIEKREREILNSMVVEIRKFLK